MAIDRIADLVVSLTMETGSFTRGASAAERRAQAMGKRFDSVRGQVGGVGAAVRGAAAGFATAFGAVTIAGIAAATGKALEYAGSLGEVASQLGVNTTELQQYRHAATQVGIGTSEMDGALAKLTRTAGEAAQGGKAQQAAFERLGISVRDANGHVKSAGVLIPEIAQALQTLPDPAERAAVMVDLFGRAGQKMLPLLEGGAAGVRSLTDAASKLGVVLSPEQIRKADEAADKFAALKQVLEAKIAGFVADNADTILRVAEAVAKLGGNALVGLGKFGQWATGVGQRLTEVDAKMQQTQGRIDEFDRRLGIPTKTEMMDSLANHFRTKFAETQASLDAFSAELAQLDANAKRNLTSVWQSFETNWNRALAATERLRQGIAAKLGPALDSVWAKVKQRAQEAGDAFHRLYDRVVGHSYIPDMVDETGHHIARLFGVMVTPTAAATEETGDEFETLGARTKQTTEQIIAGFGQMAASTIGSVKSMIDTFKSGDVLGGIQQFLELVMQVVQSLGQMGVIKLPATGVGEGGAVPGRAAGGPVVPGRMYKVGEAGPEYVTFGSRGYVHPNRKTAPEQTVVRIVPSPHYEAIIDGRARAIAAPMAGQAAIIGVAGSEQRMARRSRRSIP